MLYYNTLYTFPQIIKIYKEKQQFDHPLTWTYKKLIFKYLIQTRNLVVKFSFAFYSFLVVFAPSSKHLISKLSVVQSLEVAAHHYTQFGPLEAESHSTQTNYNFKVTT